MTIGMRLYSWAQGEFVGRDPGGNSYFRHRSDPGRRWVLYRDGATDPDLAPPAWRAWLHHTTDVFPDARKVGADIRIPRWYPRGSLAMGGRRPGVSSDREGWSPDQESPMVAPASGEGGQGDRTCSTGETS